MGVHLLHRTYIRAGQPEGARHVFISFHIIHLLTAALALCPSHHNTVRRYSPWQTLHFLPFFVFFAVSVIFREEPIFDDLSGFFVTDRFIPLRILYSIIFFLSVTVYSSLLFIEIRRHQRRLRDAVSYTNARLTLNWLKILSITFYAGYIVVFIPGGIGIPGHYY
ncbi:MAG: hypothetical protein WAV93_03875 [Bacteroidales bacterium]